MDYYIVRIYRRDEQDERNMTGIVETVGGSAEQVFRNTDELWRILRGRSGRHGKRAGEKMGNNPRGLITHMHGADFDPEESR